MNRIKNINIIIFIVVFGYLSTGISFGQDTTGSLAFKRNRPRDQQTIFYHPDIAYVMWHQFNLIKEANAGNALAQHELGIRYIAGDGIEADTQKAAYWIGRAAKNGLPGACYNYGILLNNGWGIKWNPFGAFEYFLKAARNKMPQAEYVVGLVYTDNLIVKRNWSKAYQWIKKSADDGFSPAKETLAELSKRINLSTIDTSTAELDSEYSSPSYSKDTSSTNFSSQSFKAKNNDPKINSSSMASSLGLVFIDFSSVRDTTTKIPDKVLVEDLLHRGNEKLVKEMKIDVKNDSLIKIDSAGIKALEKFAEAGSPEALTLLGRLYQKGQFFKKDLLRASVYYIRAIKLDSPRSPLLLWQTTQSKNYYSMLKNKVDENDPRAMFVWYGLFSISFDNQLVEKDALTLLQKSAALNFIPALNELGLDYYTGKFMKQDREKALEIWKSAANMGSSEAKLRLYISDIYGNESDLTTHSALVAISHFIDDGSVLAQATLAYCFEKGIGTNKNIPDAVKYFRFAAQRGSQFAYNQLKQLYDSIRPDKKEFQLN